MTDGERKQLMFEYMVILCRQETDDLGKPKASEGRVNDLANSWGVHRLHIISDLEKRTKIPNTEMVSGEH